MSSSQVGSGVVGELKWELPRLTDFTGDAHRAGSACSGRRISLMIFCSAGVRSWPNPADFARCTNVVSLLRYFGRAAHVIGTAVRDPDRKFASETDPSRRFLFAQPTTLCLAPHRFIVIGPRRANCTADQTAPQLLPSARA
jgi:hypothetical protein